MLYRLTPERTQHTQTSTKHNQSLFVTPRLEFHNKSMSSQDRWWKRLSLSICQFNVLCQIYEPNHLPNNQCSFHVRSQKIFSQLSWANADVVCLQEVNPVSAYRRNMPEYDILFVSKADSGAARKTTILATHGRGAAYTTTCVAGGAATIPSTSSSELSSNDNANNSNGNNTPATTPSSVLQPRSPTASGGLPLSATAAALAAEDELSEHEMRHNVDDSEDGAIIGFKRQSVEVISCKRILLQEPASETDPTLAPGPRRARQFALIAHAFHIASKRTFFVLNVHMKANGDRSEERRRICHLKQIMARVAQLRAVDPSAPLFFVGDLNADPESGTLQMLCDGKVVVNGSTHFLGQSAFKSAMREMCGGQEPEMTILDSSYGNGPWWTCLDYILYESSRATPIAFLTPPSVASYGTDAILMCGSDHIPLVCEFVLGKIAG